MTIKELVKAVIEGNIKSVEVYEDYFQSWGNDKRSMFLAELTAVMVSELAANTRWEEFTYDRCRHCCDYLKKKMNEELTIQDDKSKPLAEEQRQKSETDSHSENDNCNSTEDLTLRTFFGEYLTDFLREAIMCKNGSDVARLVNWYIERYKLDKDNVYRGKPLHDALYAKGIIKIGINGWNKAIRR